MRRAIPPADTVWPVPLRDLVTGLEDVGLQVTRLTECSTAHRETADRLTDAFLADRSAVAAHLGRQTLDELVEAHRLWSRWLGEGRIRKFAVVAQRSLGRRSVRRSA